MKKIFLILLTTSVLYACKESIKGNGNVQKQDREVSEFSEISVSGNFQVFISQGETYSVVLEADENLIPIIITEVRGDELSIKSDKNIGDFRKLNVYVTMRKIERIAASGACTIKSNDELRSQEMDIDLSGASEMQLGIRCDELKLDMSGACKALLHGAAESFKVDASGSCALQAFELKTVECDLDMSGAGKADIYASNSLRIDVSGASQIRYMGNPQDIKQESSGAASISAYNN